MTNRIYKNYLAHKCFGQNFLSDQFIIDSIVKIINPRKDQAMVEIGSGLAALTEPVSRYLSKITAIEIDRNLVIYLQKHPFLKSKITIYQQNAMTMDFRKLSKELCQPLRIFGSLPYNISVPLIFYLLKYIDVIVDMNFILQKEVADRLVAKPNKKAYGHLSIILQYLCHITLNLEIPPKAFIPSPKVNSTMVHLVPRHTKLPIVKELHLLNKITKEAFNYRRKIIRNSLSKLFTVKDLIMLEIDPNMRAENISVAKYCQMANYLVK